MYNEVIQHDCVFVSFQENEIIRFLPRDATQSAVLLRQGRLSVEVS